eukprot:gene36649-44456_t
MNAGMEDWHLTSKSDRRKLGQYSDVILTWYMGYYAAMYVVMSTGPTEKDWKVIKDIDAVEILQPSQPSQRNGFVALDPRLYTHNNHLYIEHFRQVGKRGYILYSDRLHYNASWDALYVQPPVRQFVLEGELGQQPQKNWVAFEYQPNRHSQSSILYYVHSINPHRIVRQQGKLSHQLNMSAVFVTKHVPSASLPVLWRFGEPRGGTPARLIHTAHGTMYLTFFHSQLFSRDTKMQTYYMGAYLFQPHPPFAITHITPDIIACKQCYNEEFGVAFKGLDYILFPMGFVVREHGHVLFVSAGRNDNSAYILKLNKTALVSYMVSVETQLLHPTQ